MSNSPTICIAGKNRIAVEGADFVRNSFPTNTLCVSINRTDTGEDTWQPSLKKWALRNSVNVCPVDELYKIENLCFVSLEFDRLIDAERFENARLFNIHFSFLPEYKGMYTSIWPILEGKEYSGVSLHLIDKGIDTGDIIDRRMITIPCSCTSRELYERYLNTGIDLFVEWFPKLLAGSYSPGPQPAVGSSYRSKSSIDFSNVTIDLNQTAWSVHNQIRAFCFPEYQLPTVMGNYISRSTILPSRSRTIPGILLEETSESLIISTLDYDISLTKESNYKRR